MAENKTKPTAVGADDYLAAIADDARRNDCEQLAHLMTRVTQHPPVMWGPSIVGFGSYHYKYESGREGDSCLVGFASRKSDISVYLSSEFPEREALLARLGKHKMAKACLSIRKLSDVDLAVLEQLVQGSVAQVQRRHP
ncbi:MAG: hypothetical protein CFE44_14855 [Burkholderiales bacterium PBB4]|nr:MAG: hypothetical protein CFE44_14855 [Burkholderiales bacterium PBB4]